MRPAIYFERVKVKCRKHGCALFRLCDRSGGSAKDKPFHIGPCRKRA